MIALTTGCAPPESSDVRQRQVVDAETEGWAAESSGRRWKQAVGGKGEWWRQVVDAIAEWWAAEANGGGWRHVVDAAEANAGWRGQVVGSRREWWVPEVNGGWQT